MKNLLEEFNEGIEAEVQTKKTVVDNTRESSGYVPLFEYAFEKLKAGIILANKDIEAIEGAEIEFIDKERYHSDIALKIPRLMKEYGIPKYTQEIIPQIVKNIEASPLFEKEIEKVEVAGIYINLLLSSSYFSEFIKDVISLGDKFGLSDTHKGESIVIDYSSPNMAKHLHAGHVRSTLIGEVLSKIYEANGYTVHRLNYLNDWGGMGAIMEAHVRLSANGALPKVADENDLLYQIYLLTRKAEKVASTHTAEKIFEESKTELVALVGDFSDFKEYKNKYAEFVEAGKARFRSLESGNKDEFELWQKMRGWSLSEFNKFYEILNIKHDYLLGESFYAKKGADFVNDKLKTGEVVKFTQELADIEVKKVQLAFEANTIKKTVLEKLLEEIQADIGAYVIMLPSGARMVIMRADGATIYATRDLVSAKHRLETWVRNKPSILSTFLRLFWF